MLTPASTLVKVAGAPTGAYAKKETPMLLSHLEFDPRVDGKNVVRTAVEMAKRKPRAPCGHKLNKVICIFLGRQA